jgi:uncharacterized protein YaaR (DUF327 family)
MMMFSTTFASIANIAQELVELPTKTLSSVVNMRDNELFEVYPGNFSKLVDKKSSEDLYQKRIQLWMDTDTEEKDEVLDNRLTQVSDAVNRINALLLGKRARKNVAYQNTVQHWKEYHIEHAYKRREQRLLEDKQTQDNLTRLEDENSKLKEENAILKQLHAQATKRHFLAIQMNVEEAQHTRQVHHLRTKGEKLI